MDAVFEFARLPGVQVVAAILGVTGLILELRAVFQLRGRKLEDGKVPLDLVIPLCFGGLLFSGAVVVFGLAYA